VACAMQSILERLSLLFVHWHLPITENQNMRLPDWTPERKPQPTDLVNAILARRGGALLNLDKALLWSEPLARGWNTYLKAVRTELPTSRKLRELGICTVALLTGAHYEYHHHAPDFLAAGGGQAQLDALNAFVKADPRGIPSDSALGPVEKLVIRYAAQMTLDVKVSDEVFNALREHFDETQIVELTSAIATYNMVARFLVALGITPEH
jgi:alkylhydroperoxidase family enzyme